MDNLFAQFPFLFLLIALNYALVIVSLVHLIFRTHYSIGQRLTWMVVLWILPILGPAAYWFTRFSRKT